MILRREDLSRVKESIGWLLRTATSHGCFSFKKCQCIFIFPPQPFPFPVHIQYEQCLPSMLFSLTSGLCFLLSFFFHSNPMLGIKPFLFFLCCTTENCRDTCVVVYFLISPVSFFSPSKIQQNLISYPVCLKYYCRNSVIQANNISGKAKLSAPIKSAHRGFVAKIYLKDVPRIKKGYRQNFLLNPENIKLPFMYDLIYSLLYVHTARVQCISALGEQIVCRDYLR